MVSFSAHADRREMLQFLSLQQELKKIFLVHGEYYAQHQFQQFLEQNDFRDVEIPTLGSSYTLGTD